MTLNKFLDLTDSINSSKKNGNDDTSYGMELVCISPYIEVLDTEQPT